MYWLRASVPVRASPVIWWINFIYLHQVVREEDHDRISCAGRPEVEGLSDHDLSKSPCSDVCKRSLYCKHLSLHRPGEKCKKDLRFCSLAAPYLNVFTSAIPSAGLSSLSSTWLNTTCKTGWGQPKMPAAVQQNPCPSPSPSAPASFMVIAYTRLCPSNSVCSALL